MGAGKELLSAGRHEAAFAVSLCLGPAGSHGGLATLYYFAPSPIALFERRFGLVSLPLGYRQCNGQESWREGQANPLSGRITATATPMLTISRSFAVVFKLKMCGAGCKKCMPEFEIF